MWSGSCPISVRRGRSTRKVPCPIIFTPPLPFSSFLRALSISARFDRPRVICAASPRPHSAAALAIYMRLLGDAHPEVGEALNSLGVLAKLEGNAAEAIELISRATAIVELALGTRRLSTCETTLRLLRHLPY